MTWPELDAIVDTSTLSLRDHVVLKAFSRHVNPPDEERPYPLNMIVWPGMDTLMDLTHCSLATLRRAKRTLLAQGILEPIAGEGGWRGHAPRYRINPQKIPQDEAAVERQKVRQHRRQKGRQPIPEKGVQNAPPFNEKGRQVAHSLPEKGYAKCPSEVSSSSKDPEAFNVPGRDDGEQKKGVVARRDDDKTVVPSRPSPSTLTPAPDTFPLTDELRTWAAVHTPHVADLAHERDRWLQRCRAKHYVFCDWAEEFKSWLIDADYRARQHGSRPSTPTAHPITPPPSAEPRCGYSGCGLQVCGHGPQFCRAHSFGCQDCAADDALVMERIQRLAAEEARRAEVEAETPERVTTVEPLRETAEAEPVTGDVTTVTSPAEPEPPAEVEPLVEALSQAVARRHAMPTSPPLRPLGSAPPERMTAHSQIRALLAVVDQPLYHRLIAERQAREAKALPAMAAD